MNVTFYRSMIKAPRYFDTEVDELISDENDERIDINDIDIWIDPLDATQVSAELINFSLTFDFISIRCFSRNTRRTFCST